MGKVIKKTYTCADPESFVRGGQFFFLIYEIREDPNANISGPSMAFRWRVDDGSTLNSGLVPL